MAAVADRTGPRRPSSCTAGRPRRYTALSWRRTGSDCNPDGRPFESPRCGESEGHGPSLGVRDDHGLRLADATVAGKDRPSLSIVERWLTASEATAVIAIDAPLGWPRPMAETLDPHSAGATIETPPDAMFRRATDLHIKARDRQDTP